MYRFARGVLVPFLRLFWKWRMLDMHRIPLDGPVIIAANHISYFDPLCHAYCANSTGRLLRFFAKAELWNGRITGPVMQGSRMIPIERGSGEAGPIVEAEKTLNEGGLVVLYPESTLTKNPDLLPMQAKTGVARLAMATGAPVVPLAVWGTQWVIPKGKKFIKKIRVPIFLKAGEPMTFPEMVGKQDDADARRDVTDRIMKQMEMLVRDLQALHPRGAEVPKV